MRCNENSLEEPAFCRWKEESSAERVGAGVQELQWQTLFSTLLPVLPALTKQLRYIAQEGEKAVTEVGGQFLHIAEKICESCGPLERDGTSPRSTDDSTATSSPAVVQEINRIIVALQFQDAASQRLGNLAKVIDEIESIMSRWVSAAPEHRQGGGELASLAWVERIRSICPDITYAAQAPLSRHSTSMDMESGYESRSAVELFSE